MPPRKPSSTGTSRVAGSYQPPSLIVASEMLDGESIIYKLRCLDASYRRLVDTELHSQAVARIIMDADILVVNRPDEVIDWIRVVGKPFLLGQPPAYSSTPATDQPPRHMQDVFKQNLAALNEAVCAPIAFWMVPRVGSMAAPANLASTRCRKCYRLV